MEDYYEYLSEKFEADEPILTQIILNYYFQSDIQLVSFSPFKPFFKRVKRDHDVYD